MYLKEIDTNPETDELYEKWPPYISSGTARTIHLQISHGTSLKVPFRCRISEDGINRITFHGSMPRVLFLGRYAAYNEFWVFSSMKS